MTIEDLNDDGQGVLARWASSQTTVQVRRSSWANSNKRRACPEAHLPVHNFVKVEQRTNRCKTKRSRQAFEGLLRGLVPPNKSILGNVGFGLYPRGGAGCLEGAVTAGVGWGILFATTYCRDHGPGRGRPVSP